MRQRLGNQRGASEAMMLVLMVSLLGFAGVVIDAGAIFQARREAVNLAASSARAGADVVSTDALYDTGRAILTDRSRRVSIDAATAGGSDLTEVRYESDTELYVKVEMDYEPIILGNFGILDRFRVVGEAVAHVERR